MSAEVVLKAALADAARDLGAPAEFEPQLERPRDAAFGDWSTNAAMNLARVLRRKPMDIASDLVARLDVSKAGVSEAYAAAPGFINFRMAVGAEAARLASIIAAGDDYGRTSDGAGRAVNIEFVSANPTGPLHVGHGRQAALGDAIASLLTYSGWKVTREFYYNDAGVQIANLALSVQARVREMAGVSAPLPEGGYHGEYIRDIARQYVAANADDAAGEALDRIREFAVAALRREQDLDLQAFGVRFDVYYLESSLYSDGKVEQTVGMLERGGHTFEQDGALWLRTTDYGDDKDRVMRKRDGTYTYFLPDVAYHVTKWQRGFASAINVQGADHHSTVTRVRAGLQALEMGIPEGYPEYELHQMVTVMRAGEEVKISKRAGSYVTVRDLIDEVGRDAVRYFLLMRKADSPLVFDVDVARSQSDENPIYYIQMAHARLHGIFRVGEIDPASVTGHGVDWTALASERERELVKALLGYPALLAAATRTRAPHLVAGYLLDLAGLVHPWYHKHHVLGEPEPVRSARLALARAAQIVLRNGLGALGISAPERM
ncbi:MAG: arginine--tRNA ligase [Gemmatimonadaceae bacterium]|nr:arginine--tRNA ligase [Gemmatimonadaceae bacterium]